MATKGRSPNYPAITLANALERARQIYNAEHRNPAPRTALAVDLGYNTLNGASTQIIGALTRYGILEKHEEGLRISEDAMSVFELPQGESERIEAIERLAYTPKLFRELKDRYPGKFPSEPNVRHYLVTQKDFLPKAANEVIRVYRDTVDLVSQEKNAYNTETNTDEGSESVILEPVSSTPARREVSASSYTLVQNEPQRPRDMEFESGESLVFRISKGSRVRISFSGPITQEAIGKLEALLDLTKDDYPTQAELNAAMGPVLDTPDDSPPEPTPGTPEEER